MFGRVKEKLCVQDKSRRDFISPYPFVLANPPYPLHGLDEFPSHTDNQKLMRPVLAYSSGLHADRHDRRWKTLLVVGVCACLVAMVWNVAMLCEAHRQYVLASAEPGRRNTAIDRTERVIVRASRGFDKTYASRPRYVLVWISTAVRVGVHLGLAIVLWRFLQDTTRDGQMRKWCWIALVTSVIPYLSWILFIRNIQAVEYSFKMMPPILSGSAFLIPLICVGWVASLVVPCLLLHRLRRSAGIDYADIA